MGCAVPGGDHRSAVGPQWSSNQRLFSIDCHQGRSRPKPRMFSATRIPSLISDHSVRPPGRVRHPVRVRGAPARGRAEEIGSRRVPTSVVSASSVRGWTVFAPSPSPISYYCCGFGTLIKRGTVLSTRPSGVGRCGSSRSSHHRPNDTVTHGNVSWKIGVDS
jgi:hypothetical protein